ncbi:MmcQ/YjbR family DNA-binding protein [uncultured Dysosmobacter sp.]|uniref:MmcQ/YjbR family DNA-binding protein n=1 Tax=uncultured Dysosmobacter sp. TaxID=2591384 RepID=UPI0026317A09|nr:MmcQ/YjbR family DNA-binding protein [uncultured Dysosmobacter sp.]
MKYEWLDGYLLSLPGAEKDYKPEWAWFRYMIRGKLFAAVCSPEAKYRTYGGHDLVNLKCEPSRAELLRAEYPEILQGFYCDKRTWIACLLDGELPGEVLRDLCAESHRLVLEKLPKYVQREILNTKEK